MALTRQQHNRIMRIYQDRRLRAVSERSAREEEIALHLPAYAFVSEELLQLRDDYVRRKLKKDPDAARLKERIDALTAKKESLLTQNGYPADYLEIRYTCPICKDTGYVDGARCSCMRRLISEEIYRRESGFPFLLKESFDSFDLSVFDNQESISELSGRAGRPVTQRAYMKSLRSFFMDYAAQFTTKGGDLLLSGQTGTGKTFLCACIAQAVIEQCQRVLYLRSEGFFDRLSRQSFERQSDLAKEEGQPGFEEALACDLLILDDLGTERRTDFTIARLFSLIDGRKRSGRSTIISTNLNGNHIINVYGERIASRLAQYTVIPFYGKDLRLRRGTT